MPNNLAPIRRSTMYRTDIHQIAFTDFNQSCGMQLDSDNEWVRLADRLQWGKWETEYAKNFKSNRGNPAKSFRMVLGALLIQKKKGLSDRKLVKEITENPYLQYFLGMPAFTSEAPFTAPALVYFRKRLSVEDINQINEDCLRGAGPTPEHCGENEGARAREAAEGKESGNKGTFIMDATCSPSNIRYPQDFSLLNEAREKLEKMIDFFNRKYDPWKKPRTYREVARKEYLALAKSRRRTKKQIRATVRKMLGYVKRDLGYLEEYMAAGYVLDGRFVNSYLVILELYRQQKYMFDNKTNQVDDRIVSINQPYIRPIVRGKARAKTEFGAKYDVSIDGKGHARLERISFDAYCEGNEFQDAVERYRKRTGHYPARALVDQIYRNSENRRYCKEHGIEMTGPRLGRPPKDKGKTAKAAKKEYQDNTDRIEVERFFSRDKHSFGAGLIMTKLDNTTLVSIALSILAANIFETDTGNFFVLYLRDVPDLYGSQYFIEFEPAA